MIAFVEQVVGGPAALVGYSAGASVALWVATQRPDLVSDLGMISAAFDPAGLIVRPDADGVWPPQVIAAYAEVSPDGEEHFPVIARKIAVSVDQGSPLTAADLGRVTCPALVIAADDDIVTLEHTVELYRALPDGYLAVVPAHRTYCFTSILISAHNSSVPSLQDNEDHASCLCPAVQRPPLTGRTRAVRTTDGLACG